MNPFGARKRNEEGETVTNNTNERRSVLPASTEVPLAGGGRYAARNISRGYPTEGQVEILDLEPAAYSHTGRPKMRVRAYLDGSTTEERVIPAHDIVSTWEDHLAEERRLAEAAEKAA